MMSAHNDDLGQRTMRKIRDSVTEGIGERLRDSMQPESVLPPRLIELLNEMRQRETRP
jgi:hypothetical protein